MQGLSLRLVVLPDAHLPTLRLYLVNEGGEPRRYLLSDKLNPTRVVIRDDSGSSIDPADDGRDIPDFDSGAKAPVIETLAGHAEVPIDEEAFTFHRKGSPSDYALFWRPFGYSPFKPGTYRIRAVWRSSHGFVGELVSNEVTLVLPVPEP